MMTSTMKYERLRMILEDIISSDPDKWFTTRKLTNEMRKITQHPMKPSIWWVRDRLNSLIKFGQVIRKESSAKHGFRYAYKWVKLR